MWIYKLERKTDIGEVDVMNALVVRAGNDTRARYMAADKALDEGARTWQDPNLSTCERIGSGPIGSSGGMLTSEAYICIDVREG